MTVFGPATMAAETIVMMERKEIQRSLRGEDMFINCIRKREKFEKKNDV